MEQQPCQRGGKLGDRVTLVRWWHFAVVVACLALYVPCTGSYGLWDPWETHYAEVAREICANGDWISLQWRGSDFEDTFWSKPPLTMWSQAIGMTALDVPVDDGAALVATTRTEWGVRLPGVLFGILGLWSVGFATRRMLGTRAGTLATLVLATAPMYALIAHQAITDIYLVATITGALCLAAVVLLDEQPRPGSRALRLVAALALLACATPQLVALAGRAGVSAASPYAIAIVVLLVRIALARSEAAALAHVAFVLAGLSILAKGVVGLGIALATIGCFVAITRDVRALWRLRPLDGLATIAVVALPWHHAMYALHGQAFVEELFLYNHWKRFDEGVHGLRAGAFGFYFRQVCYGMLPWIPLVVGGALGALRPVAERTRGRFLLFVILWTAIAHATVAASTTKFNHYIFPALPPLAILAATCVDDLARGTLARGARLGMLVAGMPLLGLAAWDLLATQDAPERLFWMFSYDYVLGGATGTPWPDTLELRPVIGASVVLALAGVVALAVDRVKLGIATLAIASVGLVAHLGWLAMPEASTSWSQKATIARYYEERGPTDRLFAFWLFFRGETFYTANELADRRLPPDDRTVVLAWQSGLDAWRARHPGVGLYVLVAWYAEQQLRRYAPEARLVETGNTHVKLMALPARP